MKLRNKKTGENGQLNIIEFNVDCDDEIDVEILLTDTDGEAINKSFESLDELKQYLDEWEDYTPQEPLIKDEDVRKIVLSWYNANFPTKDYEIYYTAEDYRLSCHLICIDFQCNRGLENLDEDRTYTITELCGEE